MFMTSSISIILTLKLSTRPEKRIGSDEIWDRAEEDLKLGFGI